MTPEEQAQMKSDIAELKAWKTAREKQQLTDPVDDTSRLVLRVISSAGLGSHPLTQSIGIPAVPTTINVPAAFTGTVLLEGPNGTFEVPYF